MRGGRIGGECVCGEGRRGGRSGKGDAREEGRGVAAALHPAQPLDTCESSEVLVGLELAVGIIFAGSSTRTSDPSMSLYTFSRVLSDVLPTVTVLRAERTMAVSSAENKRTSTAAKTISCSAAWVCG